MRPDTQQQNGQAGSAGKAPAEEHRWPPSPTAVVLFLVVVFSLGGPITSWAVTR